MIRRWLCVALALAAGVVANAGAQANPSRALWVWNFAPLLEEASARLAVAHAAFEGQRSYAGFAIHHYGAYRQRFPR